jgi:hypothetical protein
MRKKFFLFRAYLFLPVVMVLWLTLNGAQKRLIIADRNQWYRWQHLQDGWTGFAYLFAN